jgi:hypothetical protein
MNWGSDLPAVTVSALPASVVVVVDNQSPPSVELLKAAKAGGAQVAFSTAGTGGMTQSRLKARLQAIKDAGLGWKDFWVPGK